MSNFHHPQPLTDEQIALLEAVKPRILAEAATFDMEVVFDNCGAPACIAGHLILAVGRATVFDLTNDLVTASGILGVDRNHQVVPLFYLEDWDDDLAQDYGDSFPAESERAEVAIRAIDRYIANTKARFAEAQT